MKINYVLKELTPEESRCILGSCPAVYEFVSDITQKENYCAVGTCPAVYESKRQFNGKDVYLIIGKKIENPSEVGLGELEKKIGKDEILIEVPRTLIDNLKR